MKTFQFTLGAASDSRTLLARADSLPEARQILVADKSATELEMLCASWRIIPSPPARPAHTPQLHAGDHGAPSKYNGGKLWHTGTDGRYWSGSTHHWTPAELLAGCESTVRDLLVNHPELKSSDRAEIKALREENDDLRNRALPDANFLIGTATEQRNILHHHWRELAHWANLLACAKDKRERELAAMKVFVAIGNAKDELPELRTLDEARAALSLGNPGPA